MDENNQQNITEDISPEEAELRDIAKEWLDARRREHWMLVLWTVFAVIAVIVLAFTVLNGDTAQYAPLAGFALPLIVWCFIRYRDYATLLRLIQEHPTIEQQEALAEPDPPKRSSGLVWRTAVLVICCLVFGVFGVLLVPILFRSSTGKTDAGSTILKQIQKTNERHRSNMGGIMVLLCFLSVGAFLFYAMFCFVASGRVTSANQCARAVYQSVTNWQGELELSDEEIPLETGIYHIYDGMTPDEDSVAYNIYRYFQNNGDYWCAIVCDEEGEILYTFYSNEEITEDELTPMEREQQCDIETNLFTQREVVGWYAPQE